MGDVTVIAPTVQMPIHFEPDLDFTLLLLLLINYFYKLWQDRMIDVRHARKMCRKISLGHLFFSTLPPNSRCHTDLWISTYWKFLKFSTAKCWRWPDKACLNKEVVSCIATFSSVFKQTQTFSQPFSVCCSCSETPNASGKWLPRLLMLNKEAMQQIPSPLIAMECAFN